MVMGCYGIGITRTVAAVIEQNYDADGIIWPWPVAPYHVHLVSLDSAKPEIAVPLYEMFVNKLTADFGKAIATGEFGADMKVALVNDGPVTIVIDTKARE